MNEIERKFLVKQIPDFGYTAKIQIIQFYICSNKNKIVRVRKFGNNYNIGIKKGRGMVRIEKEIQISPTDFDELSSFAAENRIAKTRYLYPLGKYTA